MKQLSKYLIIIFIVSYAFLPVDIFAQENFSSAQQTQATANRNINWWWLLIPVALLPFALFFWPDGEREDYSGPDYKTEVAYHDINDEEDEDTGKKRSKKKKK